MIAALWSVAALVAVTQTDLTRRKLHQGTIARSQNKKAAAVRYTGGRL